MYLRDEVDVCLISHNHYDHTDLASVAQMAKKQADTVWCVPLGCADLYKNAGVDPRRIVECDWYDSVVVPVPTEDLARSPPPLPVTAPGLPPAFPLAPAGTCRVVCTPCQHFSGRSLTDRNSTLWSSWCVLGTRRRFYFAGDTGYRSVPRGPALSRAAEDALPRCPAFKEIGRRAGPFDLALLPIGAYAPRWFMSPVHTDPWDAVELHKDIQSLSSLGMHWGTFVLTGEPMLEPPALLREAMLASGLPEGDFTVCQHGESRVIRAPAD